MSATPYLLAYLMHCLRSSAICYLLGGAYHYSVVVFAFIIIPVLDLLIGEDNSNATAEQLHELEKKQNFRLVTLGFVVVRFTLVIWGAYLASLATLSAFKNGRLSVLVRYHPRLSKLRKSMRPALARAM